MGTPLLIWMATLAHAGDCPDRWALLDALQTSVLEADFDHSKILIRSLEDSFGCGATADPELLGRMWLLEAATLTYSGEREAAGASWRAARRTAPAFWIEDLGGPLRDDYEAAARAPEPGTIDVQPPLFWGSVAAIDGALTPMPAEVPAGLHLVQAGTAGDQMSVGKIVLVFPGQTTVIDTGVAAAPEGPTLATTPAPARAEITQPFHPYGALGAGLALGAEIAVNDGREPAAKRLIPLELGLSRHAWGHWYRAALSVAPLLGGRFLYAEGGEVGGSPVGVGGHIAGGWTLAQVDLGAAAGISWPGRIQLRAVVSRRLGDGPLRAELRAGANLATARAPEPSATLLLGYAP